MSRPTATIFATSMLLASALACSGEPARLEDQQQSLTNPGVALPRPAIAIGDRFVAEQRYEMGMSVRRKDQVLNSVVMQGLTTSTITVLALDKAKRPTRMRVEVSKIESNKSEREGPMKSDLRLPVKPWTFLVTYPTTEEAASRKEARSSDADKELAKDTADGGKEGKVSKDGEDPDKGKVTFADQRSEAVPKDLADAVRSATDWLRLSQKSAELLSQKPRIKGQHVNLPQSEVRELLTSKDDTRINKFGVRYVGNQAGDAPHRFDVEIQVDVKLESSTIRMEMRGPIAQDPGHGLMSSMELKGSVHAAVTIAEIDASLDGSGRLRWTLRKLP